LNKILIKTVTIFAFIVLVCALFYCGFRILLYVDPMKLTYRDSIEMGIGETKTLIFSINKSSTLLRYADIHVSLDSLPQSFIITNIFSMNPGPSRSSLSSILNGENQKTIATINASTTIEPGTYKFYARLSTPWTGNLGKMPITVIITEAADDIVNTSDGPVYRANLPGETRWEPVKETTVLLGAQKIPLTYRDTIDMNSYGYKGILFEMNTAGTELEGKKITYTLGDWDNNQHPGFAELMKVGTTQSLQSFDNLPGKQPISAIMLRLSGWNGPLNLGVQVEVEGLGIIGRLPLTVNCHESSDDFTLAPGGGGPMYLSGGQVEQKTASVPRW
jgi:hypothetical protein